MKLNKWLYGVAALSMLAACSERDISGDDGGGKGKFDTKEGLGYIGISLQLPEQPSTRAESDESHANDQFDDGLATEYNVKNAALLLFWGTTTGSEADAQFVGAYKISPDEKFDNPNGDNITTSFQKVATLNKKFDSDGQLWGLALVNYNDQIFKIGGGNDVTASTYGTLTVVQSKAVLNADGTITSTTEEKPIPIKNGSTEGMKFSDFRMLQTAAQLYAPSNDGLNIFMTNSPLCDKPGEKDKPSDGYKIRTLAKLDKDKISENEQTAKLNPAGCIFVERAVAKVTISTFPTEASIKYQPLTQAADGTVSAGEEQTVKLKVVSAECLIDNEETDSYFVRYAVKGGLLNSTDNEEDIWTMANNLRYRFVGNKGMNDYLYDPNSVHQPGDDASTWYRTYWCQDPNYSDDKIYNDQAKTGTFKSVYKANKFDNTIAFYPRENTFALQHQNYQNTTRVVFKVQYEWTEGEGQNAQQINVYCKAGDPSVIFKEKDAKRCFVNLL